ncbi:MAG: radical SAM protein [Lachnospiraceae bacterium]|nr:radical SAM protein [Lachnospiraceae bacterium]
MHYTGTIWRPPYEASSLLLEVTAGCTHHRCKFCTLYADLPFRFRMSPMEDVEADLKEARTMYRRFMGRKVTRTFLTGANPFVLKYDRLMEIAGLVHRYFPGMETIGSFARVTDITLKTDAELTALHGAGYDGLTIGMETADDEALRFMEKGYLAADIIEQCRRLDRAGIRYSFFYLTGISGAGRGEDGARATAAVCNRLHPALVGANMLTIYPDAKLYEEIRRGNWQEESEKEKYREVRALVEGLEIPTEFAALGASNAFQFHGVLPKDKKKLLAFLDDVIKNVGEDELRRYRESVHHL